MKDSFKSIIIRKSNIESISTEFVAVDTLSGKQCEVPSKYYIEADYVHFRDYDAVIGCGLPQQVVFNDPATVAFWEDGTKTVVKASKDDKFDKKMGLLTAFFQKYSGLTRRQANLTIEKLLEEE